MMEARLIFMAVVCLCIAQMAFGKDQSYIFKTQTKQQQFVKILKGIRCNICQNQSVFESNTDVAKDLRQQVFVMFNAGWSRQQIYTQLRKQYGDHILFATPLRFATLSLWFVPMILLFISFYSILNLYNNRRK